MFKNTLLLFLGIENFEESGISNNRILPKFRIRLINNIFSKHIEDRVNQMVRDRDQKGEAGHVYIRVVFIGDKHFETRAGVRKQANELYGANSNQIIEKYKYRAKGES